MREAERGRRRSRRRQQAPGWGCTEEVQDCHGGEPDAFVESYLTSGRVRLFVSFSSLEEADTLEEAESQEREARREAHRPEWGAGQA